MFSSKTRLDEIRHSLAQNDHVAVSDGSKSRNLKHDVRQELLGPPATKKVRSKIPEVKRKRHACRDNTCYMTPQGLELQKYPECDVLLGCATTRSRSRRSDMSTKYGCRESWTVSDDSNSRNLKHDVWPEIQGF